LGNPILGDDGVGWRVAEEVLQQIEVIPTSVEIDCVALGGLSLMERMVGYDRVVLIDSIATGQAPPGTLHAFPLEALTDIVSTHSGSAHDTSLQTALQMGRAMGAPLPERIFVVGVETEPVFDFSEELTPPVAAAVPEAARRVLAVLGLSQPAPVAS
jgi:hydrogenase maturation protease